MQRGDIVTSISGRNVRGMSVLQAKDLIMGPEGSSVVLGVHREARGPQAVGAPGEFFEVNLIRATHVPASRENSRARYSQSPAMQNRISQRPSASPMVQDGRQQPAFMSPSVRVSLPKFCDRSCLVTVPRTDCFVVYLRLSSPTSLICPAVHATARGPAYTGFFYRS